MKTALAFVVTFAALAPAQAQIFRPEAFGGAALGAVVGAVIGHNDGRHGWEGAAYGAGAGLLLGSMIGNSYEHSSWRGTQVPGPYRVDYVRRARPIHYHAGYHYHSSYPRYGYRYPRHHGHYASNHHYRHHRPYRSGHVYYGYRRPDYRGAGIFLGGLAGAIIGHNDGRHGWEGAAYGAGLGYLLGSAAERNARRADAAEREAIARAAWEAQSASVPAASAPPQQVTIINNYYNSSSPMSSANGMFGR